MKRNIALLITLILAISLVLVGCSQADPTKIRVRWEKETHVFNITLAEDLKQSYLDELRPVEVTGTYTLTITPPEDETGSCVVTGEQEIFARYEKLDMHTNEDGSLKLKDVEVTPEDAGMMPDEEGEDTVIFKSTTKTEVVFENKTSQKPVSSSTTVNGFYAGKKNQNLTNYTISTVYDYSEKRPTANITLDGKKLEHKFTKNSAGKFIDSNQILIYLRSLDKSSSSFQDSPSISVFDPYTQSLQTASFTFNYKNESTLTDKTRGDDSKLKTNLNIVSVSVAGKSFMTQENLTDSLLKKDLDFTYNGSTKISKFTTVRFRVGYFTYEIDYSNESNSTNWSEIWQTLSPAKDEKED